MNRSTFFRMNVPSDAHVRASVWTFVRVVDGGIGNATDSLLQ